MMASSSSELRTYLIFLQSLVDCCLLYRYEVIILVGSSTSLLFLDVLFTSLALFRTGSFGDDVPR
jgi:hypothetical protein